MWEIFTSLRTILKNGMGRGHAPDPYHFFEDTFYFSTYLHVYPRNSPNKHRLEQVLCGRHNFTISCWAAVEKESALQFMTITDGVFMTMPDSPSQFRGRAAREMDVVGISYERVDGDEVMRRYPQFRVPSGTDAIFQPDTGIVDAVSDYPQILICNGAGHAYKFASLLGKILSELAIDGKTWLP